MTKGVIRRDKEPRVATTLDRRLPGGEGERIGVVGVMNRNRRAGLVCKARSARAVEHHDFVFLLPHLNRRAVAEAATSRIASTCCRSNHSRAVFAARSGLFWWSA